MLRAGRLASSILWNCRIKVEQREAEWQAKHAYITLHDPTFSPNREGTFRAFEDSPAYFQLLLWHTNVF
jgi:hypothetical protein